MIQTQQWVPEQPNHSPPTGREFFIAMCLHELPQMGAGAHDHLLLAKHMAWVVVHYRDQRGQAGPPLIRPGLISPLASPLDQALPQIHVRGWGCGLRCSCKLLNVAPVGLSAVEALGAHDSSQPC